MELILLTYKNTTLRQSDVDNLNDNCWLNDTCINFYYDYLSENLGTNVLLMDPSASFLIVFENDMEDLEPFLASLDLDSRRYVFFPVNNNTDHTIPGAGSHWTLLVLDNISNTFYSYNSSMFGTPDANSNIIADKLRQVLNREIGFEVKNCASIQNDGFNCGIFILGYTEQLWQDYQRRYQF